MRRLKYPAQGIVASMCVVAGTPRREQIDLALRRRIHYSVNQRRPEEGAGLAHFFPLGGGFEAEVPLPQGTAA